MKKITNPLESLYNIMVFSSQDWAADKRGAWMYGIVVGWGGECKEENEEAYQMFNQRFGWNRGTWNRLNKLHEDYTKYLNMVEENRIEELLEIESMYNDLCD